MKRARQKTKPAPWPPAWATFADVAELEAADRGESIEKSRPPLEEVVGARIAARMPRRAPEVPQDASDAG